MKTRVKINLWPPSYKERYQIIPIREDRHLFPKDGVCFMLQTNLGPFRVRVMEHPPSLPPHIHLRKTKWFEAHPGLKAGDIVFVEVRGSGTERQYRLLSPEEIRNGF